MPYLKRVFASLALCTFFAMQARGATFELAPDESFLTIAGKTFWPYGDKPVSAQFDQSLTASIGGTLDISQWTTSSLRINDGWINPLAHAAPSQPMNFNAAFSGKVENFIGAHTASFLIQNAYTPLFGVLRGAESVGQYHVDQTIMTVGSQTMLGAETPQATPYGDTISASFANISTGAAVLSQNNGRYRIEIPIATDNFRTMQNRLELTFAGKIVAYSDENPALTPGVASGRFETRHGWTGESSNQVEISTSVGNYIWSTEQQEWGAARLKPFDSSENLHQMVLGEEMLLPDTKYQVTFDISNQRVETNYPQTGDLDAYGSAEVFLALGSPVRTGDYDAAGGYYRLANLADIQDGTWRHGESFIFDTTFLTPDQLSQEVYLVLRGTNWEAGSWIGFDNINMTIIPEPSSVGLAVLALLGLTARLWPRQRS